MSRWPYAGTALAVLALAACSGQGEEEAVELPAPPDPAPVTVQEPAEPVDAADLRLPFQLQGLTVVDPGWDRVPVEADGTFLGVIEEEDGIRFRAIDSEGTIQWEAQRSAECSGHALSRTADGIPLVVLTEREGESAECTTARAYELSTGEPVWGPTTVPGPWVGPGLTFAAGADEDGQEDSGEAGGSGAAGVEVLSVDTGEPVPAVEGAAPLGEYFGTVLHDDGTTLTATEPDGAELWSRDLTRADQVEASAASHIASEGLAAVGSAEGGYELLSLADGATLATGVADATTDPTSGYTVAAGGPTLQGFDPEGEPAWTVPVEDDLSVHAAGGVLAYLSDEAGLHVYNITTGAPATGYDDTDGTLGTPEVLTVTGAGAIRTPSDLLLVTTEIGDESPPTP